MLIDSRTPLLTTTMAENSSPLTRLTSFVRDHRYSCYVLLILTLIYLVNQLHVFSLVATNASMAAEIHYGTRVCEPVTREQTITTLQTNMSQLSIKVEAVDESNDNLTQYCEQNTYLCEPVSSNMTQLCDWLYLGQGFEYQLLAGPLFIMLFSISGIPMGLLSELNNINRKWLLVICLTFWSAMTLLGGFAHEYWHLALSRLLLGVFSAGCVPFSASIISDYFKPSERGIALGFYTCGIYVGYSFTFLLVIAETEFGWRSVYYIASAPGFLLAVVVCATVKEPKRIGTEAEKILTVVMGQLGKLRVAFYRFMDPLLLLLCFAGALRNGAGIVWAYNIAIFFDTYHPDVQLERWLSWIPLVFGCIGAIGGGFLSDKMSVKRGLKGRLLVLIISLLISAPFSALILYLPMPWTFVVHAVYYVAGEMWIAVCIAIVVDLVPTDITASAIAVFFFIIQILGGNMPLLVPPLNNALGSMKGALVILFPGMIVASVLVFTFVLVCVKQRSGNDVENDNDNDTKDVCIPNENGAPEI